ncbi:MAG: response regulator [bacterium]
MAMILIIDDDPDFVDTCRLFLEQEGFEVKTAYNRDEGMKSVSDHQPDLVILDVMMDQPDDGIAMARGMRKAGFDHPIVMLTSIGKVTGMEYGPDSELVPVDEFLEKPVTRDELITRVRKLLASQED